MTRNEAPKKMLTLKFCQVHWCAPHPSWHPAGRSSSPTSDGWDGLSENGRRNQHTLPAVDWAKAVPTGKRSRRCRLNSSDTWQFPKNTEELSDFRKSRATFRPSKLPKLLSIALWSSPLLPPGSSSSFDLIKAAIGCDDADDRVDNWMAINQFSSPSDPLSTEDAPRHEWPPVPLSWATERMSSLRTS